MAMDRENPQKLREPAPTYIKTLTALGRPDGCLKVAPPMRLSIRSPGKVCNFSGLRRREQGRLTLLGQQLDDHVNLLANCKGL